MRLSIKTLDGKTFSVDIEESKTFAEVKQVIQEQREDLPAEQQKLIHSGKILKDDQTIESVGIKDTDFIVCMVKPKPKAAVAAPAPVPASTPVSAPDAATSPEAPAQPAVSSAPTAPAVPVENPETVRNLMEMGFPEEEVRAALRAAMGNGDIAVEFLMNGIPERPVSRAPVGPLPTAASGAGGGPLEMLRRHPQFDALRRLVQGNPAALSQVLAQIGQQSPELLAVIHQNQEEFVRMMNEPVQENPTPAATGAGAGAQAGLSGLGGLAGSGINPAVTAQLLRIANLPDDQRSQVASTLGLTPDQLTQFSSLVRNLPPEQLQQLAALSGLGGPGGGMGLGGPPPGAHVIRLTPEEVESVNRLTEMGFERNNVMQAFLACDRNESMAANLLMDGMGYDDDAGFPTPALPVQQTPSPAPVASQNQPEVQPPAETAAPAPSTETQSEDTGGSVDQSAANQAPPDSKNDDEDMYS